MKEITPAQYQNVISKINILQNEILKKKTYTPPTLGFPSCLTLLTVYIIIFTVCLNTSAVAYSASTHKLHVAQSSTKCENGLKHPTMRITIFSEIDGRVFPKLFSFHSGNLHGDCHRLSYHAVITPFHPCT